MVRLGLQPPYTEEDVAEAYRSRVMVVHPDRGGNARDFIELQAAFERAEQFVHFRRNRRDWIAARIERYVALEETLDALRRRGAEVETETKDWLAESFGDFAQLETSAVAVRLANSPRADEVLDLMTRQHAALATLRRLELPGCKVSDAAIAGLVLLGNLEHLDLRRTPVTSRVLSIVEHLPRLRSILLGGTSVGWWRRWRLRSQLRKRRDFVETLVRAAYP